MKRDGRMVEPLTYDDFLRTIELERVAPVEVTMKAPAILVSPGDYVISLDVQNPRLVGGRLDRSRPARLAVSQTARLDFNYQRDRRRNIRLKIRVVAYYRVPSTSVPPAVMRRFLANASLQVWPYLRTCVSAMLAHMDLPPLPMPWLVRGRDKQQPGDPTRARRGRSRSKAAAARQ